MISCALVLVHEIHTKVEGGGAGPPQGVEAPLCPDRPRACLRTIGALLLVINALLLVINANQDIPPGGSGHQQLHLANRCLEAEHHQEMGTLSHMGMEVLIHVPSNYVVCRSRTHGLL